MKYRIFAQQILAVAVALQGLMTWAQSVSEPTTPPVTIDPKVIAAAADEAARRMKIIMGPTWQEVKEQYGQWMKQQVIYTPAQLKQLNDKIEFEIRTLPADELQEFIDDWNAKLKIVRSSQSTEARDWLGVYLTNMTDGYRRRYLQKLGITDPAKMSAQELESAISRVRADQASVKQYGAGFERSREASVAAAQSAVAATASARTETQINASAAPTYQTPYTPSKPVWEPPKLNFSIGSDGTSTFYYSL